MYVTNCLLASHHFLLHTQNCPTSTHPSLHSIYIYSASPTPAVDVYVGLVVLADKFMCLQTTLKQLNVWPSCQSEMCAQFCVIVPKMVFSVKCACEREHVWLSQCHTEGVLPSCRVPAASCLAVYPSLSPGHCSASFLNERWSLKLSFSKCEF